MAEKGSYTAAEAGVRVGGLSEIKNQPDTQVGFSDNGQIQIGKDATALFGCKTQDKFANDLFCFLLVFVSYYIR